MARVRRKSGPEGLVGEELAGVQSIVWNDRRRVAARSFPKIRFRGFGKNKKPGWQSSILGGVIK